MENANVNRTNDNESNIASKSIGFSDFYLVIFLVVIIIIAAFLYRKYGKYLGSDGSWKNSMFEPPAEREAYLVARDGFDTLDPNQLEELKKLLMRRAIASIPIILALQNEGNSIERLYRKGILTDDLHYKVKEMKAFVDREVHDVQYEAESYVEGWGEQIWPQAFHFHQMIQKHATQKDDEVKNGEDEKKQVAAEKRKEKLKKQKEMNAARKRKEAEQKAALDAERIARELIEAEQREKLNKTKTK